jgi:ligand-binding sensor domain-containing protein/signal transduction histidine kinase
MGTGCRVACLLAFLGSGWAGSLPSPREYSHRIWRVQDGLPQNRILAISQTADGYLWIGTSGGLVRFDGLRFFVFDRANTPAFRDDSILSLSPSRDGSLWIGTEGGSLLHYDKGAFAAIGPEQGLTNPFVRALYEDRAGTLWIGTDRGFFRLIAGKVERLDGRADIPVAAITGVSGDRAGRVWVAADVGLFVVENGVLRRYQSEAAKQSAVRAVHEARDGTLWLLTAAGLPPLEAGRVGREPAPDRLVPLAVCDDREGNLWIGTLGEGLVRSNSAGVVSFRDSGMLPDNTVFALFEDREGNLWVGTGDGLLRLSRTSVQTVTSRDGLVDDNVMTIAQSRDGTLWLATISGEVYRFAHGRVLPFRLPAAPGKRVREVYQDSKGVLWFGTSSQGIVRVAGGQAISLTAADGLRSNMIRQFLEDRQGNLWIGLGSGLSRWDGRRFQNYYLEDGLSYGSVRVLLEDRTGDLLVGTDNGLNRVHDGRFVRDAAFAQLGGERIWALHEDAAGALWVGTRGGGLFRIFSGRAARITVRDGLLSNAIFQVLEDARGQFWFSSPAGVFSVPRADLNRVADGQPGPLAVLPYGTADGLESTQMNGGYGFPGCRTATGDLWFPSVKGAVRIDPGRTRVTHPSPVLIESITVDEKPLPVSAGLVIPPGHGKLQIDFTASSLLSPERVKFRYKLEGFDADWSAPARDRSAHYTNLPPGQYRFRVTATDSVAPLEASEASLPFVWRPQFYRTAWFYGLCAAAAALVAWAALRLYVRQTKARYALLFAERTRLAREMHDTVIQGCAGISTLLEAASSLQHIAADRTRQLLEQARVQARLTLDEARQAIWDLRQTQWGNDIPATLQNFARQLSAEKNIPIEVEFHGDLRGMEERTLRGILLVAREAIRNAANHAGPRLIRIRVGLESGEARLEVMDDGRGFVPAEGAADSAGHYGIIGMRERVEQLGGSFQLRSSPGGGTAVIARVPVGDSRG